MKLLKLQAMIRMLRLFMDKPKIINAKNLVIVIDSGYSSEDFNCRVCGLIIRGLEDVMSVNNYGCWSDFEDCYYWPNKTRWESGWRPKKEDVQKKLNN